MGLPWSVAGDAVAVAAGVAMVPRMACHVTACHGILCHVMGCSGGAIVCHGWYHGIATACYEKSDRVEP